MAIQNKFVRAVVFLLKLLVLIIVVLVLSRPFPSQPRIVPEALSSFHQKIEVLKRAHQEKIGASVRISPSEVNSFYTDLLQRGRADGPWPPWGTVFYFKGNDVGFYWSDRHNRLVAGHVELYLRGATVYTDSVVLWLGILPVPASAIRRLMGNHPLDMEKQWTFPDYITNAHIEKSELVLETQ